MKFNVALELPTELALIEDNVGADVSAGSLTAQPIPIHVCKAPVTPLYALIQSLPYMFTVIPASRSSTHVIFTEPGTATLVPELAPIVFSPVNN